MNAQRDPNLFYSDDDKNWIEAYWCRLKDESRGVGIHTTISGTVNPPDGGVRMFPDEALRLIRRLIELPVFDPEQLEHLAADCLAASRIRQAAA